MKCCCVIYICLYIYIYIHICELYMLTVLNPAEEAKASDGKQRGVHLLSTGNFNCINHLHSVPTCVVVSSRSLSRHLSPAYADLNRHIEQAAVILLNDARW